MVHKFGWLLFLSVVLIFGVLKIFGWAFDPISINSNPNRSISTTGSNNTFTISTSRCASASYTINFSAALTLTTSNGRVTLDYSLDGGTTWTTIASVSQVFGVSVTITTNQDMVLHGVIPANALVRINRATANTVTITIGSEEEVLL